tara:strand:+ start:140 stop:286 length:147 start_codon:yes stop_codon:yes gene_type:complete
MAEKIPQTRSDEELRKEHKYAVKMLQRKMDTKKSLEKKKEVDEVKGRI